MGSVVLDAVNSFFGQNPSQPQRDYREALHQSEPSSNRRRSRTPKRASTYMSEPTQQASGSSAGAENVSESTPSQNHVQHTSNTAPSQPPSPPLDARSTAPSAEEIHHSPAAVASPTVPSSEAGAAGPRKIKVRDLQHIQSFASEDMGSFSEIRSRSRSRTRGDAVSSQSPQYEISGMKVEDIIEMVAGLLTKITATNDRQHEHLHRQPPSIDAASHLNPQTSSVLAFHGKNVPSITILSYLSRINKYCPTSYEVFLALLVYFDRMTERVNSGPMQSLREANQKAVGEQGRRVDSSSAESLASDKMEGVTTSAAAATQLATPPASGSIQHAVQQGVPGTPHSRPSTVDSPSLSPELNGVDPYNLSHFFVVDSFNIHRLVIAGVTCASKFFSDIFYTNSRYAKVSLRSY
jgi:hypothetical protein